MMKMVVFGLFFLLPIFNNSSFDSSDEESRRARFLWRLRWYGIENMGY